MVFNVFNSWYIPPNNPFNIIVCNVQIESLYLILEIGGGGGGGGGK